MSYERTRRPLGSPLRIARFSFVILRVLCGSAFLACGTGLLTAHSSPLTAHRSQLETQLQWRH